MNRKHSSILSFFHSFIPLAALVLLMTSCNEHEALDGVNEKTLLVYFPWTGSDDDSGLLSALHEDLREMQSAITSSSTLDSRRVLVFMAESASEANLYELVYNEGSAADKQLIKSYGNAERYSTKDGIQEVLQDVRSEAPALNYAFITGGHGCGWTPDSCWTFYPLYISHRSFGSVSDIRKYGINITDLAQAINDAGMHMQFILFDNCYMQNIETAYALKDATNFLIGTTSEILADGMPYSTMFSQLIATAPNYSTATQAFLAFYNDSYGTISAVDCRQMDALASEMKSINSKFSFNEDLLDSVQVLDGYTPRIFYDFRDYTRWLTDSDAVSMHHIDSLLDIAVRSEMHTGRYYTAITPSHTDTIKVHSGLTISDPSEHSVALKAKQKTSWWQATH